MNFAKTFAAACCASLLFTAPSIAGGGTLDGPQTLSYAQDGGSSGSRSITCNSHNSATGQNFFCEYTDRMINNRPNDSMFVGELISNGRGNVFRMIQRGDGSSYVALYMGRMNGSGVIEGTFIDVSGNTGTFSIP
jgi:hypothetical protein